MGKDIYFQLNGKQIDIRQWWPIITPGALKPSRRGVTMPLKRYVTLSHSLEELSKALNEVCQGKEIQLKIHLGDDMYASVQSPYRCVNLRQWFNDAQGVLRPGKGVALNVPVWDKFLLVNADLHDRITELKDTVPCNCQDDHPNQLGMLRCAECNPDSYMDW
jgi:hypothetical protein